MQSPQLVKSAQLEASAEPPGGVAGHTLPPHQTQSPANAQLTPGHSPQPLPGFGRHCLLLGHHEQALPPPVQSEHVVYALQLVQLPHLL